MFRRNTEKQIKRIRRALKSVDHTLCRIFPASARGFHHHVGERQLPPHLHNSLSEMTLTLDRLEPLIHGGANFPPKVVVEKLLWEVEVLRGNVEDLCRGLAIKGGSKAKRLPHDLKIAMDRLEKAVRSLKPPPQIGFQKELKKLLDWCELTPYGLGELTGLDASYLYKLLRGEKANPRRKTVAHMGETLLMEFPEVITPKDVRRLLKAAGYRPLRRRRRRFWPLVS